MKIIYLFVITVIPLFINAQESSDYAVELIAEIDSVTPSITIKWNADSNATSYYIYKKTKDATGWGNLLTVLNSSDSMYIDNSVLKDTAYEYKVQKSSSIATAYGYIFSGINYMPDEIKGTILLIVDSLFSDTLSSEIYRLMKDISGDGWAVIRYDVSRTAPVADIKSIIVNEYNNDPQNVKALLLLGHIPVPYSGDINPDGHPDHKGAWPCDAFYADINGVFTDIYVTDTIASRIENRNVPGDGKYDQNYIPSNVELLTGRIDMYNMPAFSNDEVSMMKNYLDRNHAWRNAEYKVPLRCLIDDNFGAFSGEAFAASAWKSFAPIVSRDSVKEVDFFTTLNNEPYLWAYGCGGGSYQSAGGIGATSDFANDSVQSVFTVLFGSYFGDWDSQNNFLKAPLASKGLPLASAWSGRPHWHFHHMALGEPIGFSARWAMNNSSTYFANYAARWAHIALMGDPTIRLFPVVPPDSVYATDNIPVEISWTESSDTVDGYLIYRSKDEFGIYERVSENIVDGNVFYDYPSENGQYFYMVRAAKLETTSSGIFYNLSTGITGEAVVANADIAELQNQIDINIYPNPSTGSFAIYSNNPLNFDNELKIYNIFGQLVYNKKNCFNPQMNKASVNTGIVVSGIYILNLSSENFNFTRNIQIISN